jgi:hypothetical protein
MSFCTAMITALAAIAIGSGLAASPAGATQLTNYPGTNCHGGPHGEQVLICDGTKGKSVPGHADRDRDDRNWPRRWQSFPDIGPRYADPLWRKGLGGPL